MFNGTLNNIISNMVAVSFIGGKKLMYLKQPSRLFKSFKSKTKNKKMTKLTFALEVCLIL